MAKRAGIGALWTEDGQRVDLGPDADVGRFTTEVGIVPSRGADPMRLPRLNTNDLPKRDDHPRHDWTAKALVA